MTLQVEKIVNGPFQENCYLVWDSETMAGIFIDPGAEPRRLMEIAKSRGVCIEGIFNTHGHIDHVGGVADIVAALHVPFAMNEGDSNLLLALPMQAKMFGLTDHFQVPTIDRPLFDGDEIHVGQHTGRVLLTPGHTQGGVSFLFDKIVFVGDTLFRGSIGRTDLPGGNTTQLQQAIFSRLLCLDEDTVVHCGHGPDTRIGDEKQYNPFLSGNGNGFMSGSM